MTSSPKKITKVLIANRGEIAVRIARAAKDAGIQSVAVYADQDRDAMHVRLADEAYALHGTTGPETYLVIEKILAAAKKSGADAVHPGYGFLAENATFAQAVIDAGMIWIGPSPKAIEQLGDKVSARHIAEKAGAPLAPGTLDPVSGAAEVLDFVKQHGLPVAIKAAFGGGGRGIKVAYKEEEVAELFESATREAIAAFGRECTRRGVPPPTVSMFGSQFITWRGVPIIPCDKLKVTGGKTNILLLRTGESRQGVVGLYQPNLPGQQTMGLSVRFMGINHKAIASYLVSLYCSLAVLTDDAIAVLENVDVGNYYEYK